MSEENYISVIVNLNESTYAGDLISNHQSVINYYSPINENRELNHNFLRGFQYTSKELAEFRNKKKDPIVLNQIKSSERTVLGLWSQNKYDVEFSANSPDNDDLAEVLQQLDIWESNQQQDDKHDIELVRQAWAGGNSFQECYMDVTPGREPIMYTKNQNPFAIYWDPNSSEIISREDAQFVDRDTWVSLAFLEENYPEHKKEVYESLISATNVDGEFTDNTPKYVDRTHEQMQQKNNKFLLTERFYKINGWAHYAMVEDMKIEIDEEDLKEFKATMPNVEILKERCEELYIAIVCKQYSESDYLYNGKYHCQPRDPQTGNIIWPILEMVAESLMGEPQGYIDHERGAQKIINAMMSNILSSATHSAASSMLIDASAFLNDREAKLAARFHSDSDRSFQVKKGRIGEAMKPMPRGDGTNQDHQYALNYAMAHFDKVSSTPPALQGQSENASTSGILNEQRIEQGFVQLQTLMKNYKIFLRQRAKLRYYYWRTYYNTEKTFRVIDKSKPEMFGTFMTINKMEAELDDQGRWTGAVKKMHDINAAIYDISIKESIISPMYRDKQLKMLSQLLGNGIVQSDPGISGAILYEILRLSDAPAETKTFLRDYSTLIQQSEMQKRQFEGQLNQGKVEGQELQNMQAMQNIAQQEAEQTSVPFDQTQLDVQAVPQTTTGGDSYGSI